MQRELVERARSSDLEAFSDLARASLTRLYAVATLILRDSDRAQDAVQDALLLAWQDIHALRDPDAWEAWLHRLTVRARYKHARKEQSSVGPPITRLHTTVQSCGSLGNGIALGAVRADVHRGPPAPTIATGRHKAR